MLASIYLDIDARKALAFLFLIFLLLKLFWMGIKNLKCCKNAIIQITQEKYIFLLNEINEMNDTTKENKELVKLLSSCAAMLKKYQNHSDETRAN